jgi:hypothetical protein
MVSEDSMLITLGVNVHQLIGKKILYKPPSEELGDDGDFCKKRLKTKNSF